jgi:DNA polymerase-4
VAVERVCNPYLRDRPVVLGDASRARSVVAAVSPESRRAGIFVAMPIDLARKRCPDLVVVDANFTLYGRVSQSVQKHLLRYSPRVESASWDATYLDLTGMQALFGAAVDTAARLRRELKDSLRLDLAVGVASNKLVSHVASQITRPSGVSDVPPGDEARFLAPLPVEHLPGVGVTTQKRLRDFNIQTIGELAETEPGFLLEAFGRRGCTLHEYAQGIDDSPVGVVPQRPSRESLSREVTLTHDSNDRSKLGAALLVLAEELGSQLRVSGRMARRVRVHVTYADGGESERTMRLPQATNLDCRLLPAANALLSCALTRRVTVRRIGVRVLDLCPVSPQFQLFTQNSTDGRQRALMGAVDAIRSRYGGGIIRSGRTLARPGLGLGTPAPATGQETNASAEALCIQ